MKSTLEAFYTAFSNLDAEAMVSCYHDSIIFKDPAFGTLQGERACNMWRMLINSQKGKDFSVSFSNITFNQEIGTAQWEAQYTFTQTGRKVHNKIDAQFEFLDGKISSHIDSFNLRKWASQAMGFKGQLLGGTSFFKKKLQAQTNRLLDIYESKK